MAAERTDGSTDAMPVDHVALCAAGGLVVQDGLVLVVHRPHLNDWSFPKGKLDPDDADLTACALREVWEETGYRCAVGQQSLTLRYTVAGNRTKAVTYWRMSVLSGDFTVNNEVDEGRWLSPDEAAALLSYDSDRQVLAQLLR